MLAASNSLLRSTSSVAKRHGAETNWIAFGNRVNELLKAQHKYMFPTDGDEDAPAITADAFAVEVTGDDALSCPTRPHRLSVTYDGIQYWAINFANLQQLETVSDKIHAYLDGHCQRCDVPLIDPRPGDRYCSFDCAELE